jgi:hypothetical protein
MLMTVVVLFLIASIFGIVVLKAVLKDKRTPSLMVLMHGCFAFGALLLLITFVASGHTSTLLVTSMVMFIIAALGGFTLLTIDLSKKPIPKAFALGHPLLAITGLVLLIIYLVQNAS